MPSTYHCHTGTNPEHCCQLQIKVQGAPGIPPMEFNNEGQISLNLHFPNFRWNMSTLPARPLSIMSGMWRMSGQNVGAWHDVRLRPEEYET